MRKQTILTLSAVLVVAVLVVTGCNKKVSEGKVIASYDGGALTDVDLKTSLDGLPERVRTVALQQKKEFVDSLVAEKLLLQEAERKGLQHLQDVKDLVRQARDRILVAKLVEQEVESKSTVSAQDVRAYYENNKKDFMTPYRLKASHILVRSREEAEDLRLRIEAGASFEDLAKEHSMDPTGSKGGDIGFFEKGQLIPEVEEVAFTLKEGELSDVIQSPFGFHVMKVTGEAKPQVQEFEQIGAQIQQKLIVEKKTKSFNGLIERLKDKANIKVDDEAVSGFAYPSNTPASSATAS
jgi:peptidyl-prolyl cis-trans isomerase C